jgi:hypothetical protein
LFISIAKSTTFSRLLASNVCYSFTARLYARRSSINLEARSTIGCELGYVCLSTGVMTLDFLILWTDLAWRAFNISFFYSS